MNPEGITVSTIRSKFDNTCRSCGDVINRGDMIVLYTVKGYVFHAACHTHNAKHRVLSDRQYSEAVEHNKENGAARRMLLRAQAEYEAAQVKLMAARAALV